MLSFTFFSKVEFGETFLLASVQTWGFDVDAISAYVREYTLEYSFDGATWYRVSDGSGSTTFTGNTVDNYNTLGGQENSIEAVFANSLKIIPTTFEHRVALRWSVIGCSLDHISMC